ncbi:hypothetical protein [Pseudomonas mosselii]|uniref:Uncharacterized protein n=1 Tax=Pseudomonas mosselii TaxID=78327 RepID=A0A290GX10_9PSED|nr:hypothetical protein [Pseudomonas mosselii]ATB63765.1 hypothetical protein CLJ08_03665 [Pseudomonas mosselii]MBA6065963.1 hypothetical protein [Pseudomonas mosselii]
MQQHDWEELRDQMDQPYGKMTLMCDGFRVELMQCTDAKSRSWCTEVYVNDSRKYAWLQVEGDQPVHEEARRFFRRSSKKMFSGAEIALYRKTSGKKRADELASKTITSVTWDWSSFNSLKKHLEANNTSIERLH